MKFRDLDLPSKILRAIEKMGYEEMTLIQEATYQTILSGRDLCALAETGSGKTAACVIPLVQKIDTAHNAIQGLVIVPTRELCIQYVTEIRNISMHTEVVPFAVYGGFDKEIQVAKLNAKVHVLVATPGRLIDLIYDHSIDLSQVKCVILDEADELMKADFLEDIEFIMSCLMQEHQTLLFAATMAADIRKLAQHRLHDPQQVSLIEKRAAPESIEHYFVYLHPKNKQKELLTYLKKEQVSQAIIFCNARHKVDRLFHNLRKEIKNIDYIHSGLSQGKRTSIFRNFKNGNVRYLIATDVAGRGLDFSRVSHIMNWDFPNDGEAYTHRTGRSGRMGKKGKAFSFVARSDLPNLRKVIRKKNINPFWIGKDPLQENKRTDEIKPEKLKTKGKKRSRRTYRGKGKKK